MELQLISLSDDAPSGENLEYDPLFSALEMAAQSKEERQIGDEITEAEPPDYKAVVETATAVLEQSHDLRAAVYLALAQLQLNGFPGFAAVTTYIRGCLDEFWDTCHPQLDAEDDDDPTMRVNTILGLAQETTVLRSIRRAPLTQSNAFGRISLRDIGIATGEVPVAEGETPIAENAIAAAFKDTPPDDLTAIFDAVRTALDDVKQIDAIFNDKIPGLGPDLGPLMKVLQQAATRLADETGGSIEPPEEGEEDVVESAPVAKSAPPGAINGPRDVEAALDRIMAYYAAHEPSSPVPLLLNRAKRLVGADFLTLLRDVAPDGVENAYLLGGLTDEE